MKNNRAKFDKAEYDKSKAMLGEALDHHYAHNTHHPEHYEHGVYEMNILDLVEMLCDWSAAVMRHDTGHIYKSIAHNEGRFNLGPQLTAILRNSVELFPEVPGADDPYVTSSNEEVST